MDIEKQTKKVNQQLQPTGRAWNYIHGSEQVDTEIVNFVDGLNNPFVDGFGNHFISEHSTEASMGKRLVNAFLKSFERLFTDIFSLTDQVLADNDGFDETDASNWERVFGLDGTGQTLEVRKGNILRKQSYPQGVAERGNYLLIQDQLQAAGFDVYITENRFADGSGGWLTVNPVEAIHGEFNHGATFFGNTGLADTTKIANRIEEDIDATFDMGGGDALRATFFIGGEIYPARANVEDLRKDEFRELILKLKPAQTAGWLLIDYI